MNATNPFLEITERLDKLENLILTVHKHSDAPKKQHLPLKEAAEYTCLPVPTFREHLRKGNITGSKPGKSWIFSTDDLDKFLDDHKRSPEKIRARAEARLLNRK